MKKILLISIVLSFIGCANLNNQTISSLTEISAKIGLEYGINNPDQRIDISNYLYSGATAIRSLMSGNAITPDEFQSNVVKWFPSTAVYSDIVESITGLYASFYPQISGGTKNVMNVLESIAEGLEKAAYDIKNSK